MTSTDHSSILDGPALAEGFDPGMSNDELLHCYRTMQLVRAFGDICLKSDITDHHVVEMNVSAAHYGLIMVCYAP